MDRLHPGIIAALVLWTASSCFGQVVLTQKNPDSLYRAGEKVVWTVASAGNSKIADASYIIRKNGKEIVKQGALDFSSGTASIESELSEPGQLILEVNPTTILQGANHGQARDGAIVDATQITPVLPRPDDFDAWWNGKLAELDAVPANPLLEPVNATVPAVEYCKVTLDNLNKTHVHGQFAKPARKGKFPAILQFQYAGVYTLQPQWVTNPAKAGWLALNVCAHDMPIDDSAEIKRLADGPLKNYPAIGNTSRETSYFLQMYLGDCQALKYLASRPDWDGKTLVVLGDSMGGQQSFAVVGLVGQRYGVTFMSCHMPAGCDVGADSQGRKASYPFWPNHPETMETARYFDPCNFAPRIKATSLVSAGLYDGTAPAMGIIAAFNLLPGPKELITVHSDHTAGDMRASYARRDQWLSALIAGKPVPVTQALR